MGRKYDLIELEKCNMCDHTLGSAKYLGKRLSGSQGLFPRGKKGIAVSVYQCSNCGLIFPNPLPQVLDLSDHYKIPANSYWSEDYFTVSDDYFKSQIETYFEISKNNNSRRALDIGAGVGKCMIALQKSGFEAFGIEPSETFYNKAITEMKIPTKYLENISLEDVDEKTNEFDFITFGAVLEHLYDPSQSIVKALSMLKSGGLIHIEVPSARWLTHKIINAFYKLTLADYAANLSPFHTPFHIYEFDLDTFRKNGLLKGYEVVFYQYFVCDTFLPSLLDPILKPVMNKTNSGMQLEVWLQKK